MTAPRRPLGRTSLQVSPICLGGNVFGWTIDEPTSFAVLDAFLEGGGNFIDTADVYSRWAPGNVGGESETILGRWMASRGCRDRVVIATKVGHEGMGPERLRAAHVESSVDACLKRLGVETIDLLYAHQDDPGTPLDETLGAFDRVVRAGKARAIGASNCSAERLAEARAISAARGFARYDVLQPWYNAYDRGDFEGALQALCVREQIAVAPYFSLARGFFTGKYRPGQPPPKSARAEGVLSRYANERGFRLLSALESIARARSATPGQIALAWLLRRPAVVAPIASATSVAQARELLGAMTIELTDEELRALDVT
jgi:aryl-alcohol dehydrogenase-like predicted oxidoreductase